MVCCQQRSECATMGVLTIEIVFCAMVISVEAIETAKTRSRLPFVNSQVPAGAASRTAIHTTVSEASLPRFESNTCVFFQPGA